MSGHSVTWNHSGCEHEHDDCTPEPRFECLVPVPDPLTVCCRVGCEECETYSDCDACVPGDTEEGHPEAPHCDRGHPLRSYLECQALLFLTDDPSSIEYADGDYHDGPIEVEWDGEYYTWFYPEAAS